MNVILSPMILLPISNKRIFCNNYIKIVLKIIVIEDNFTYIQIFHFIWLNIVLIMFGFIN